MASSRPQGSDLARAWMSGASSSTYWAFGKRRRRSVVLPDWRVPVRTRDGNCLAAVRTGGGDGSVDETHCEKY